MSRSGLPTPSRGPDDDKEYRSRGLRWDAGYQGEDIWIGASNGKKMTCFFMNKREGLRLWVMLTASLVTHDVLHKIIGAEWFWTLFRESGCDFKIAPLEAAQEPPQEAT